jgi:hypothetical protein
LVAVRNVPPGVVGLGRFGRCGGFSFGRCAERVPVT